MASRVEHTLDVDGLIARTPQRLLVRWRKYYEMCPFGDDWMQAATVATAAINPHTRRQRKAEDFIPKFATQAKWESDTAVEQTTQNLNAFLSRYESVRRNRGH